MSSRTIHIKKLNNSVNVTDETSLINMYHGTPIYLQCKDIIFVNDSEGDANSTNAIMLGDGSAGISIAVKEYNEYHKLFIPYTSISYIRYLDCNIKEE